MISLWGAFTGWLGCLILDRFHVIAFHGVTAGGRTYCESIGYPKTQDWFWYGAFIVAGIVAGRGAGAVAGFFRMSGRAARLPPLPAWPGPVVAAVGLPFLFHHGEAMVRLGAVAAVAGLGWPWVCRSWYEPEPCPPVREWRITGWPWLVLVVVVPAVWMRDPSIAARDVDGTHEGGHLLYAAHWVAGERPLVGIHTEYGPLMTASQVAWMERFGHGVLPLRRSMQAAQITGLALCLLALGLVARTRMAPLAGGWLMLTATAAAYLFHPWGWPNLLRIGPPLAATALLWRSIESKRMISAAAAGCLAGLALLYSPEFGLVGLAMFGVLILLEPRGRSLLPGWIGGFAGTLIGCWLVMYGTDGWTAIRTLTDGGYLAGRLAGHGARPVPEFRWRFEHGWHADPRTLLATVSVWGPALIASAALAGRHGALVTALAVGTILAHLPTIARPLGQQTLSAPVWIALVAVWIPGGRMTGWVLAAFAVVWGCVAPFAGFPAAWHRMTDPPAPGRVELDEPLLRGMRWSPAAADRYRALLPMIRALCPPDRRVLIAASFDVDLVPLAGRLAPRPFPVLDLAVLPVDRMKALEDFRANPPPVAVVGFYHLDLPLAADSPELSRWIERAYTERFRTPQLRVLVPRLASRR